MTTKIRQPFVDQVKYFYNQALFKSQFYAKKLDSKLVTYAPPNIYAAGCTLDVNANLERKMRSMLV
jgi:hypothetical protein